MTMITVPILVEGYEGEFPLIRAQAAKYLGVSTQTLQNYITRGIGPRCYKIGPYPNSPVVYFEKDLIRWLDEADAHKDNRTGRGRADAYGYVNPVGVNTREHTG